MISRDRFFTTLEGETEASHHLEVSLGSQRPATYKLMTSLRPSARTEISMVLTGALESISNILSLEATRKPTPPETQNLVKDKTGAKRKKKSTK